MSRLRKEKRRTGRRSGAFFFLHLPEDGIGIGQGIVHAGGAEIDGHHGAATFGKELETGAAFTDGNPAISANGKGPVTAADAAKRTHDPPRFPGRADVTMGPAALLARETAVGIDGGIAETAMAKGLGVHMTASVTPEIKGPAGDAQRRLAAVAMDDRRQGAAVLARGGFVGDYFHRSFPNTKKGKAQAGKRRYRQQRRRRVVSFSISADTGGRQTIHPQEQTAFPPSPRVAAGR